MIDKRDIELKWTSRAQEDVKTQVKIKPGAHIKCHSKYNKTLVGYPFLQSEAFTLVRLYRYIQKEDKKK